MNTSNFEWPVDKKPLYSLLSIRLRGLIDGIPHQISNLANASALLGDALLNINWVGFYLMKEDSFSVLSRANLPVLKLKSVKVSAEPLWQTIRLCW